MRKEDSREDGILKRIGLLKEEMRDVARGILNESIIPYIKSIIEEEYDSNEFDNEYGANPDFYSGMNYGPDAEARDREVPHKNDEDEEKEEEEDEYMD